MRPVQPTDADTGVAGWASWAKRLDSANRSFFALVSTALVPYLVLGLYGCGLLSLAAYRVADDGLAGLHRERYHVRNWDTLKMVAAKAATAAFFFLPALHYLRTRYLAGRELAADRQAFDGVGSRPLAGALYRVLEAPAWSTFGAAAALGGAEYLELRVSQLETGQEPPLSPIPRWALAITVVGLIGLSSGILLTITQVGGAMPMMDDRPLAGGTTLAVVGGIACTATWLWLGWLLLHRVLGHHRLRPPQR